MKELNQKVRFRHNSEHEWSYGFYICRVVRERGNPLTDEYYLHVWHIVNPRGQSWTCGYNEVEPYEWSDADQPGPEERPWELLGED